MVDSAGYEAVHSGAQTVRFAGHVTGEGITVQANTVLRPTVWTAMATAFSQRTGSLGSRMLTAVKAAQAEGGDIRGQRSAALKIVSGVLPPSPLQGTRYDIRVDDHPEPLSEMRRLLTRQHAYNMIDAAVAALRDGDPDHGLALYRAALLLDPDEGQLRIWGNFPLLMADRNGQFQSVEESLRKLFEDHPKWREVVRRYIEAQPLQREELLDRLLALASNLDVE